MEQIMDTKELEDTFAKYNIDAKGQEIFKQMYYMNSDLLKTINFEILSDKFISKLTFEELSRIVCDKKFQETLINLDDKQYALFFKLKDTFLTKDNWITGSNMIIKALNNSQFNQLSETVLKNTNTDILKSYFNIINQEQNYFGIESIEQLENYEQIKNDVCSSLLNNPKHIEGLT